MVEPLNDSQNDNDSYTIFGPMGVAIFDDGIFLNEAWPVKMALSIYLGVVMILSLTGNFCTCYVIARNRSMRTPTNYYLFNLAVTDLLTAAFIPMDIYLLWIPEYYPWGEVGCRMHYVLWDFVSNCGILIITAFTIERYLVVTKPFLRQKLSLNSRVIKIVCIIWLISSIFSITDLCFIDLLEVKKYVFCYSTAFRAISVFVIIEIFVFFVIPMTVIIVLYVLIIAELNSARKRLQTTPVNLQQNRGKAVKMLAAVAASFFIFWSPYSILRTMMVIPRFNYEENYSAWRFINYLCYNAYMSPVANPILYSLMSRKFRQAFKGLLKGRRSTNRKRMTSILTTSTTPISRHSSCNCNGLKLTKLKLLNT